MNLLYKYKNGNHYTEIYDDGTRIRETIEPEADHFIYEFPEGMKITLSSSNCDKAILAISICPL